MYYTYMLRCKDNSIYTGITTDIERRMREHFSKDEISIIDVIDNLTYI